MINPILELRKALWLIWTMQRLDRNEKISRMIIRGISFSMTASCIIWTTFLLKMT